MSEVLLYEIWLQATLLLGSWIPMWFLRGQRCRMETQIWKLAPAAGLYLEIALWRYTDLPLYLKAPLQIIVFAGIGCRVYDLKFRVILVYMVMYIAAIYSTEMISYLVWDIFDPTPIFIMYGEDTAILHPVLQIFGYVLTFLMVMFIDRIFKREGIKPQWSGILPVLGFAAIIVSVTIVTLLLVDGKDVEVPGNNQVLFMYLLCMLFLVIVFLYNIGYYANRLKEMQRIQEEKNALYEMKLQKDYYEQKIRDEERIREIYHDFKNHLLVLERKDSAQNELLISELKEKIAGYEDYRNTGNEFLDIILKEKLASARQRGIVLSMQADPGAVDFMIPLDISTIFGNLSDCAIQVCRKVEDTEPCIDLKVKRQNRLLIISMRCSMKNGMSGAETDDSEETVKEYCGNEIKNISRSVECYQGEYSIRQRAGELQFCITIPVTAKAGGHVG